METDSPPWDKDIDLPQFSSLQKDAEADVVVIGGGITGLTTAYLLAKAGKKIVLIEKNRVGFGATGVTTAMLTYHLDTDVSDMIELFGEDMTRQFLNSHSSAIDLLEQIITDEAIDCEFIRCSDFIYADSINNIQEVEKEREALQKIGVNCVWHEKRSEIPWNHFGAIELQNQAKFHPLKFLKGILSSLNNYDVSVYEQTESLNIHEEDGRISVHTPAGTITAPYAVVATYAPFDNSLYFRKAFYTSYVLESTIPKGILPEGIYEDTQNPYHYFRIDPQDTFDRFILGGEDHRSDIPINPDTNFQALQEYQDTILHGVSYKTIRLWKGPILEPTDGFACIGRKNDASHVLYATAFSGNGMTYAGISAQMFTDVILGQSSPWEKLYSPHRLPSLNQLFVKGRDYSQEFVAGAVKNTIRKK